MQLKFVFEKNLVEKSNFRGFCNQADERRIKLLVTQEAGGVLKMGDRTYVYSKSTCRFQRPTRNLKLNLMTSSTALRNLLPTSNSNTTNKER